MGEETNTEKCIDALFLAFFPVFPIFTIWWEIQEDKMPTE